MSPLFMTLAFLAALGGFLYLAIKKLSIVIRLKPENRWQDVPARLANVFRYGFFQSRMLKGDFWPGLQHAVIMWGFLTLLVRKIQLLIIGYDPFFTYPEWFGLPYAGFKDFIEVAVTVAVLYGFYRRFVSKPRRFEPNGEAILVLSLIFTIMVTDFMYDGFKFALAEDGPVAVAQAGGFELSAEEQTALLEEKHWAPVGSFLADAFGGMSTASLNWGFHIIFWIQILTVFSFLVYLPMGEHFHIVTALPSLFFGKRAPLNKVPAVDLESMLDDDADMEEEPEVGINTARDMIWKDGLDAFTCTECGRCKDSCPTFLTDKPLALKWVHDDVKHHLMAERQTFINAEDEEKPLPPLVGQILKEDTLWACTTCGYCEWACPIELEHLSKFYRMRQFKVMMEGEFPSELQDAFSNYERQGNPWGINSGTRGDWAKDLDVPILESPDQVKDLDYLFFLGSAHSFDTRNQKVAKAFVEILRKARIRFAILGAQEGSTGECVRRGGNEMLFQELATGLVETLNEFGVTRIVTCDPHCYNSLKNEYPDFGGNYEVIHHTELIDQLIREGRLQLDAKFDSVIYHEPCYLARHNGIYEEPRRVLAKISTDRLMEFPMNREKAMCCGAGGARMWMEENIGTRINEHRVQQALDLKRPIKTIATACPYCTVMMSDGLGSLNKDEEIVVKDIAELVAESLV